uniref:hypothetical protein n=1 Tax=Laribacter hongkongensis TaxID=168471 RepID=UPI0015E87539|nr:hypothetical protein [Laribacter hongkongensis]
MAKTASLTAGLVAKKGEASPATVVAAQPTQIIEVKVAATGGRDYYKALTVKLDRNRYESLKSMGVKLDKKSQEIFVEALDLWMKSAASQQHA